MQVYNTEIYHFGVKGMKWGHRNQAYIDQIKHPIHSTRAQISMLKKNPLRTIKGGDDVFKELNDNVAKRVANSKTEKEEFKKQNRQAIKYQITHPIHSISAQLNVIKKDPLKALNADSKTLKKLNADVKKS